MTLTNLPIELILEVVSYLPPKDLLALCRTCHFLYDDEEVHCSATYWRALTKATFRVRSYPVVHADGRRWMRLYRKLYTQSKVYTWGNNDHGSMIGAQIRTRHFLHRGAGPNFPPLVVPALHPNSESWPRVAPEEVMEDIGVVSDVQCGGWSTVLLNSKGRLFSCGIINGEQFLQMPSLKPTQLQYPPGHIAHESNPFTAISQFSSGRSHILGLADSGRIWTWDNHHLPGICVTFLGIDLVESIDNLNKYTSGVVRKVAAGWNRSSALIAGKGLLIWEPINVEAARAEDETADGAVTDTVQITDAWIVPHTTYFENMSPTQDQRMPEDRSEEYGEVLNWLILEEYVVWITSHSRIFAHKIKSRQQRLPRIIELTSQERIKHDPTADIQGSFRSFGVLKQSGEVLIGTQDYVQARWEVEVEMANRDPLPKLRRIPALQHSGVISLAFGDYHFLALHSDGTITSYGKEPQFCGALGLGGLGIDVIRGISAGRPNAITMTPDAELLQDCLTTGRRVHFEPEKLAWMNHIRTGHVDRDEAVERMRRCFYDLNVRAEVSEYIERRLRGWEDDCVDNHDHTPSHFALSVAAAGWHSGALVLVDEDRAERTRDIYRMRRRSSSSVPLSSSKPKARTAPTRSPASADAVSASAANVNDLMTWTLAWLWALIMQWGRWFLGLPLLADMASGPAAFNQPRWIWETETFPRLRMRSGEVLPGKAEIHDSGAPEWLPIEEVVL